MGPFIGREHFLKVLMFNRTRKRGEPNGIGISYSQRDRKILESAPNGLLVGLKRGTSRFIIYGLGHLVTGPRISRHAYRPGGSGSPKPTKIALSR